jgi:hypothetical protein
LFEKVVWIRVILRRAEESFSGISVSPTERFVADARNDEHRKGIVENIRRRNGGVGMDLSDVGAGQVEMARPAN